MLFFRRITVLVTNVHGIMDFQLTLPLKPLGPSQSTIVLRGLMGGGYLIGPPLCRD